MPTPRHTLPQLPTRSFPSQVKAHEWYLVVFRLDNGRQQQKNCDQHDDATTPNTAKTIKIQATTTLNVFMIQLPSFS